MGRKKQTADQVVLRSAPPARAYSLSWRGHQSISRFPESMISGVHASLPNLLISGFPIFWLSGFLAFCLSGFAFFGLTRNPAFLIS
jgi:hypothetical protein